MLLCFAEENIKDIEFTVTTLNCQNQDTTESYHTPEHYRSLRFSSFKKPGNLGKAVRSKLTKTLYSSIDHSSKMKSMASVDMDDSIPLPLIPSPSEKEKKVEPKPSLQSQISHEKTKKKSKFCSLLWRKTSD